MIDRVMAASASRTPEFGGGRGHNLPVPLTSLLGRSRELDGIGETLRRTRLVTLTGPGGVGKTRLAIEVARRQIGRRVDGVWLIDLTATTADPGPAAEVARTLEVGGRSETAPTQSLRRYLVDRDMLLVIDNCEHVVDACAELASSLLGACGSLRILATSRESLGVSGETVWRLDSLGSEDARRLFVERARQRQPGFIPDAGMDTTIAALCERLDDLPLAIELAAARIEVMSPKSLAVFVGGFDAEAAMAVAPGLTMDVFARLVDKSVVAAGATPRGITRYRLLEIVREYAQELLVASGELQAARERHLRHYLAMAEQVEPGWPPFVTGTLIDERADDYENVRAAIEWAAESDPCAGLALFVATRDLFQMLGQADGRRIAQRLLDRCGARDRRRIEALITAGILAMVTANAPASRAFHSEARQLSAELGELELEGFATFFHGLADTLDMAVQPARAHLEAAITLQQRAGSRPGEGMAIATLGLTFLITGDPDRARELLEQALAIQTAADYRWGEGHASLYLGITTEATDPQAAATHFRHAVACLQEYRDSNLLPNALIGQAGLIARRDPATALRVTAAAWAIRARGGGEFPGFFRERLGRVRQMCEGAIAADAERIWAEGTRLGVDEAIALAFGTSRPPPPAPAGLSARELEVVRLVAHGLPNKAIAAQLHLSVRTVESHVRHILAKARLTNRTQLGAGRTSTFSSRSVTNPQSR
jgi:predicted ATPase/DNA-binding CsgD family transcriptional regulator